MTYNYVIDTGGKDNLGGGIATAITLQLSSDWQIQFWTGVGVGILKDGNVVGGVSGNPVKPTGGNDTIIVNNQVGGVITVTGSGITDQDKVDIVDGVWDETKIEHSTIGSFGKAIDNIQDKTDTIDWSNVDSLIDEIGGKWEIVANQMIFYKADNITEVSRFNLFDSDGNASMANVYKRERVP